MFFVQHPCWAIYFFPTAAKSKHKFIGNEFEHPQDGPDQGVVVVENDIPLLIKRVKRVSVTLNLFGGPVTLLAINLPLFMFKKCYL
jgi:hypothetical protein